jgi:hypothetical protein
MGLGHLAGKVPAALKGMKARGVLTGGAANDVAKAADAVPARAAPTTGAKPAPEKFGSEAPPRSRPGAYDEPLPGIGIPGQSTWMNLPPGMTLPQVLRDTPRPLYLQQATDSCGLACVRMVGETVTRRTWSESTLRHLARPKVKRPLELPSSKPGEVTGYKPGESAIKPAPDPGTEGSVIAEVLELNGVPNSGWRDKVTFGEIVEGTKDGYPSIAALGSHVVVIDGVVDSAGGPMVLIRNSTNPALFHGVNKELMESVEFRNYDIIPQDDFIQRFLSKDGFGRALFTNPIR